MEEEVDERRHNWGSLRSASKELFFGSSASDKCHLIRQLWALRVCRFKGRRTLKSLTFACEEKNVAALRPSKEIKTPTNFITNLFIHLERVFSSMCFHIIIYIITINGSVE